MKKLRWELAKALNRLMWFICPEPQKSKMMQGWDEVPSTGKDDE